MPVSSFGARPPRFDAPIDLDAHLAARPPGASAKGMFLRDLIQHAERAEPGVDLFEVAGVPRRRLMPFFDYPYPDLMRLAVASAQTCWPDEPTGEGLRRLGRGAYETLLSAQIGRVVFGLFGNDFSRIAAAGARGWRVSVSFGEVTLEKLGEGHAAYRFRSFPAFLETYQVGVIEGAMRVCGVTGEVWTRLESLGDGTLELFWE